MEVLTRPTNHLLLLGVPLSICALKCTFEEDGMR